MSLPFFSIFTPKLIGVFPCNPCNGTQSLFCTSVSRASSFFLYCQAVNLEGKSYDIWAFHISTVCHSQPYKMMIPHTMQYVDFAFCSIQVQVSTQFILSLPCPILTLWRNLVWKLFRNISPRSEATYWHTGVSYTDLQVRNLRTLGSITCLHMSSE